jgi:hypothetical protein
MIYFRLIYLPAKGSGYFADHAIHCSFSVRKASSEYLKKACAPVYPERNSQRELSCSLALTPLAAKTLPSQGE